MQITITLPSHVAAAFTGEQEATDFALAALTDHARAAAIAAASDQAQSLLRAAEAPFTGVEAPEVPTLAERITDVDEREADLRTKVRELGVTLATAAGVPQEQAEALIEAKLQSE